MFESDTERGFYRFFNRANNKYYCGDHHILSREGVEEILNLQPRTGKAKAYQVKQVRAVLISYGLGG